jgi:hypothetical protein
MSMGSGYVSELPPVVNPQMIYENGGPRWNGIDRENSCFVHQSFLAILPAAIY